MADYELTPGGKDKVRQLLTETLSAVHSALQCELATNPEPYAELTNAVDFSQFNLWLFSDNDEWYQQLEHAVKTETFRTIPTLRFTRKDLAFLKVIFLFWRQPEASIPTDAQKLWEELSTRVTAECPVAVSRLFPLPYPQVIKFADKDLAQAMMVHIKLSLEDADIKPV